MDNHIFVGSGTAIITPMRDDLSINYDCMEELIEYQVANQTDAIIVAGTTGEASTLTTNEQLELIRFTVEKVNHRIPVIAGAGSNSTQHAVELCRGADKAGADALLLVTPYYNKCSQEGFVRHIAECAKITDIQFVLYNIPGRTGVNIIPSTYNQLLEIPNVKAVKEASGNFSQIAKIASLYRNRLDIYCGNDDQIASTLALGGKGVISVLANIYPKAVHEMCYDFFGGQTEECDENQLYYLELIEALFSDINPIPIKEAMNFIGWDAGGCRLPLCEMSAQAKGKLLSCLSRYRLSVSISSRESSNVGRQSY